MNQKTGSKGGRKTGEWRHYAPRFLSKGFTEDGTRGGKLVCFEKERPPREARTKSWGAEYGFYRDGALDIDAGWDDTESDDARVLDRIRKDGLSQPDSQIVPGIVTRFALRTKCAQATLLAKGETYRRILQRFHRTDTDGEQWKQRMLKRIDERAPNVVETAKAQLKQQGMEDPSEDAVSERLRELHQKAEQVPAEVFLDSMKETAKEELTTEHGQARMRTISLQRLQEVQQGTLYYKYGAKGIRWGRCRIEPPILVLGDNVVIEKRIGRGDRAYRPFERTDLEMEQVICPISPREVLHGVIGETALPNARWILEQMGQLSYESFVAPQETKWTKYLHPQIGQVQIDAGITREEGERLIAAYLEGLFQMD